MSNAHGGAFAAVGIADGEDVVGVNGVVARRDGEVAAQKRHIVIAVDAVVYCVDINRYAVKDETGIVAGLDAVLGVAVDGEGTVACHIDIGVGLGLESRAVKGVCDVGIL